MTNLEDDSSIIEKDNLPNMEADKLNDIGLQENLKNEVNIKESDLKGSLETKQGIDLLNSENKSSIDSGNLERKTSILDNISNNKSASELINSSHLVVPSSKLKNTPPINVQTLIDIVSQAADRIFPTSFKYDHEEARKKHNLLVNDISKQLQPLVTKHKIVIFATTVEHIGPGADSDKSIATPGIVVSTTGLWNSATDGQWNFHWTGGDPSNGVDVIISLVWVQVGSV